MSLIRAKLAWLVAFLFFLAALAGLVWFLWGQQQGRIEAVRKEIRASPTAVVGAGVGTEPSPGIALPTKDRLQLEKDMLQVEWTGWGTIAQIAGGLLLLLGALFTWRNLLVAEGNLEIAARGNITSRFASAIELLASERKLQGDRLEPNVEARVGAIYALEAIARDSKEFHRPIMEVLTAYVRRNAPWDEAIGATGGTGATEAADAGPGGEQGAGRGRGIAPDVQAILTVLGRRHTENERGEDRRLDLSNTDIRGIDLIDANLERAIFRGANLRGADLMGARVRGADFFRSGLEDAKLHGADLRQASLIRARLQGAMLMKRRLSEEGRYQAARSWFGRRKTRTVDVDLKGAVLVGAQLQAANLEGATNLSEEQLEAAEIDEETGPPEHLKGYFAARLGRRSASG